MPRRDVGRIEEAAAGTAVAEVVEAAGARAPAPAVGARAPAAGAGAPARGSKRRGWTLGIVSVGLFMVVLDNLVVTVALPSIHRQLGASIQSLEWTVNAYVLAYAVLLLTGAALGDRFGRRRMFVAGLTIFTAVLGGRRAGADDGAADRGAGDPGASAARSRRR